MRPRLVPLLLALVSVMAGAGALADGAHAGTYNVQSCQGTNYTGTNNAWGVLSGANFTVSNACTTNLGMVASHTGNPDLGTGAAAGFQADRGTRTQLTVTALYVDERLQAQGGGGRCVYALGLDNSGPLGNTSFCYGASFTLLDSGWMGRSATGLSLAGIKLYAVCQSGPCNGGAVNVLQGLFGNLTLTVSDSTAPAISSVSGGLLQSSTWVRGTQSASWTDSDTNGSGISNDWLHIDGSPKGSGGNAGAGHRTQPCDYSYIAPCPAGGNAPGSYTAPSFTYDTTLLSDGTHSVAASNWDAGNNITTNNYTLHVDNTAPSATLAASSGNTVTWNLSDASSGVNASSEVASYSTDGGATWTTFGGTQAAATFSGNLPATVPFGNFKVRLVVSDVAGNMLSQVDDFHRTPNNTAAPSISGTPRVGETLTGNDGTWNGASSYARQWLRCDEITCNAISGATSTTYAPVWADVGYQLAYKVTATNAAGDSAYTSDPVRGDGAWALLDTPNAPSLSGTAKVGQTLTINNASGAWVWAPSHGTTATAVRWLRCDAACQPIAGATSTSYTATTDDLGLTLVAELTSSDTRTPNVYRSTVATPASSTVLAADNSNPGSPLPQITTRPTVSSSIVGPTQTLTANSSWSGSPTLAYQWYMCSPSTLRCDAIAGTSSTYVRSTGDADTGKRAMVRVMASNGSGAALASYASPVTAALP